MVQLAPADRPLAAPIDTPDLLLSDGTRLTWDDVDSELRPALLAFARSRGARDPEDLVQEVFLDVYRCLDDFTGDRSGLRSLFFTIAFRRVADEHRRRGRRPEVLASRLRDDGSMTADLCSVEEDVVSSETASAAIRVLAMLTDREQRVIRLRIFEEASPEEVANRLGLSNGNVRVIQARAFSKVRALLEADGHLRHPLAIVLLSASSLRHLGARLPINGPVADWIGDLRAAGQGEIRSLETVGAPQAVSDDGWAGAPVVEVGTSVAPAIARLAEIASAVLIGVAALLVANPFQAAQSPAQSGPDDLPAATAVATEAERELAVELSQPSDIHPSDVTGELPAGATDPGAAVVEPVEIPPSLIHTDLVGAVDPVTGALILVLADSDDTLVGVLSSLAEQVTDPLLSSATETLADVSQAVSGAVEPTVDVVVETAGSVATDVSGVVESTVEETVETADDAGSDVSGTVDRVVEGPIGEDVEPALDELEESARELAETTEGAVAEVETVTDSVVEDVGDGLGLID